MAAIFKRETKSYYTGMVGYVTAAVSLFFLGLYFTNRNLMYASSDFASVLYTTTLIMLFLLPAISMRSFAEDRRNKTDQLLLTSPVSIPGIVLGKFLAEVVVFALPLTVAVIMPLILTAFGTVSLVSAFTWSRPDARLEFLRARIDDAGQVELHPNQGSAVVTSLCMSDGLVLNPPGQLVQPGDVVRFISFAELLA